MDDFINEKVEAQNIVDNKQALDLREQISLNGVWETGGKVPVYGGTSLDFRVYERKVSIPSSWRDKIIKIDFMAVNFVAEVFVNDRFVANHVGGWVPFSIDITEFVSPGEEFTLKVDVKGLMHRPMLDDAGNIQWPAGGALNRNIYEGITDDVWLRAYGRSHIEDAFVKTSYRNRTLTIDYTIVNYDKKVKVLKLETIVNLPGENEIQICNISEAFELAPQESKVISTTIAWENPQLWWPDQPVLYHLYSKLVEDNKVIDCEYRRFGFREIWIEGNQFRLNGIRVNLYGDYTGYGSDSYTSPLEYTPETWPNTIKKMKSLNIRVLRWHMHPPAQYILDMADEYGLLIDCESAIYGRRQLLSSDKQTYLANAKKWIAPWIKANRNHPSIYIWGATNEMTYAHLGNFDKSQLLDLADTIRLYDSTRPVCHDGEGDIGDDVINYHYPEGYNKVPEGSIYSWDKYTRPDKPTGAGEVFHLKSQDMKVQAAVEINKWWLGIWIRGMRYVGFTDVRPAWYWFASRDMESIRTINARNAYAPVALFDKEYDNLGISSFVEDCIPKLEAGAIVNRKLVLYNDEFRDTSVIVEVTIKSGTVVYASGTKTFEVPLGEHLDIPCSFQVPVIYDGIMELVLSTNKNGIKKFEETRCFKVFESEMRGITMSFVNIGEGTLPEVKFPTL